LGRPTRKIVSEMPYNVLNGTLNPTIPYLATPLAPSEPVLMIEVEAASSDVLLTPRPVAGAAVVCRHRYKASLVCAGFLKT